MSRLRRLVLSGLILSACSSIWSCTRQASTPTPSPTKSVPNQTKQPLAPVRHATLSSPPVPLLKTTSIAPGVIWRQYGGRSPRWHKPLFANVLEFDPLDPRYRMAVVPAHGAPPSYRESARRISLKTRALAAINGSYFNFAVPRLDGRPIGLVMAQERLIHPARGDRPVFEILGNGRVVFALPSERASLRAAQSSGHSHAGAWLQSSALAAPALAAGRTPEPLGVRDALEGGPMLIHHGKVLPIKGFNVKILQGQEPRTAVGLTRAGKMLWITIDGRRPGHSMGTDLKELTQFFQAFDAVEALNWDGGGSTTMVIKGKPVTLIATGWVRAVSNALVLMPSSNGTATASP